MKGDWERLQEKAKPYKGRIQLRRRLANNSYAMVCEKKTGCILKMDKSMKVIEDYIGTKEFLKDLKEAESGFGFETAVFKGVGY